MNTLLTTAGPGLTSAEEEALTREHLPLVSYLVSEMIGKVPAHVSRSDLTSAGLAALAFAVRAYDPARGVPFGRFASIRIRGALIDELRGNDWASRSVRAKARRRETVTQNLATALGRTPTTAEIAESLGVRAEELDADSHDVQRAVVLSLDGFADAESVEAIAPIGDVSPEEHVMANERVGYLHDAVLMLPDRLRTVVTGYYFEERPMADIAAELEVTESRVSQMRAEALTLLKGGLDATLGSQTPAPGEQAPGSRARRRHEAYYAAVAAHSDFRTRLAARPVDMSPAFVARPAAAKTA